MESVEERDSPGTDLPKSAESKLVLTQLVVIALGAAALIWPAWVNGYPLVFQDTAWYLSPFSGAGAQHPGRTIGYSLFTRIALSIPSLWSIVIAQGLVTSALIVRIASAAAKRPRDRIVYPIACLLAVVLLSGSAKYVSWVMADITTSWLFFAGALFMLSRKPVDRTFAVATAALSVLAHNSHVPIAIATSAGFAAGVWFLAPRTHPTRHLAAIVFGLSVLALPWASGVNAVVGASSGVFQGTSSFLMYRFVDSGVIVPTLDRYCNEREWKSCKYRDEFARHIGQADGWFLFDYASPFYTELGKWKGQEQKEIVEHAFRCCWPEIARTTALATWQQFWRIDSSDGLAAIDTNPTFGYLKRRKMSEITALANARQRRGGPVLVTLHPAPETALHALLVLVTAGLAIYGWRTDRRAVTLLLASVMLFLSMNALVCAFGSSIHDRYQGRVVWLLPFAIVIAAGWLRENRDTQP